MAKIIAVTGATGSQGGGVVNVMKNTPGWIVRAITRNPGSEASQALVEQGLEVVQADYDDEESLARAFEGVSAIFAVTNWWEHFFRGKTADEAGELEEHQGMNLARAAANTASLEHYIWSTCPSVKKQSAGKYVTPHMDYKAQVDDRIKSELPSLAAKTTYLCFGYYPSNMFAIPFIKPTELTPSTPPLQLLPTRATTTILVAGDMTHNPGLWTRQILATGRPTHTKYANVALERLSYGEMLSIWSTVTTQTQPAAAVLVECSVAAYTALWGPAAAELALQLRYGDEVGDAWAEREGEFLGVEELGIEVGEVVGFRGAVEKLHAAALAG